MLKSIESLEKFQKKEIGLRRQDFLSCLRSSQGLPDSVGV